MRADPPRLPRALTAALLAGLLLGGCSEGAPMDVTGDGPATPPSQTDPGLPEVSSYVALGDSYTAAPFVPSTDLAQGCFRSDGNYPSLLAEQVGAEDFVDVSCSAADTGDVTGPQLTAGGRGRVPAQLRAVAPGTDLVTVGIGANDENVFARLAQGCATAGRARACTSLMAEAVPVLSRIRDNVAGVLRRVHHVAPGATVVLVGYPRLSSPGRRCARLPVPADVLDDLARFEVRLNRTLRAAADDARAVYVDMHAASAGHEICSDAPWVNGDRTDDARALAYHPFAAGQRAAAREVLEVLARSNRR